MKSAMLSSIARVESATITPAAAAPGTWRTSRSTVRHSAGSGCFLTDAGWPRTRTTDSSSENCFHRTWLPSSTNHVSSVMNLRK